MKRVISILLSLIIVFTALSCTSTVTYATEDGADIPVIHVCGYGAVLVRDNPDGSKEKIYPLNVSNEYIEEKAKEFIPVFAKAFFTQEWGEFCDVLVDILVPVFEPIALDKNGEASDGSRADWTWSRETLRNNKNSNGKYSATAYKFHYDWRLDPLVIADSLHKYIEDVLFVTGAEKVALYGRCLGSNVVAAYMQKYDGSLVDEVIHYASSVYGVTQCSKAFTGEFFLEPDGFERFFYDTDLGLGDTYNELIQSFVTLFNKTYGLDITCWAVNNVLKDIYLDIFPEVMISSFGSFPSYWSMVRIEDYDRAMDTVFYGQDLSEHSGLIDKIEYYHNNVQLKFEDITKAHIEKGIEYSNIVKYGLQSVPVTENSDINSDGFVSVEEGSFGATAVDVGETFSGEYIDNAVINSTVKYISPDKQIDASTCLSPDTTWFIKNLEHNDFPDCVNGLVSDIVNNDGFDVFTNQEYPQYLVYDELSGTISPMTSENLDTTERWNVSFFDALIKFWSRIFEIIKTELLNK